MCCIELHICLYLIKSVYIYIKLNVYCTSWDTKVCFNRDRYEAVSGICYGLYDINMCAWMYQITLKLNFTFSEGHIHVN